jgi:HSP20 family protein
MNAFETDQGYQVQVLLPGVKPEDIDLTVQHNTLTIKGQYRPFQEQGKQVYWLIQEIGSGSFERTITFPKAIEADKVETSYENGILTISVPVSEASRPKRISIGSDQKKELTVEAGSR